MSASLKLSAEDSCFAYKYFYVQSSEQNRTDHSRTELNRARNLYSVKTYSVSSHFHLNFDSNIHLIWSNQDFFFSLELLKTVENYWDLFWAFENCWEHLKTVEDRIGYFFQDRSFSIDINITTSRKVKNNDRNRKRNRDRISLIDK